VENKFNGHPRHRCRGLIEAVARNLVMSARCIMRSVGVSFIIVLWFALPVPAPGQVSPTSSQIGNEIAFQEDAAQAADQIGAICEMIKSAASANDLPQEFFARVIWQESRFRPDAIGKATHSGERARGIAQFMPLTAAERRLLDPLDPTQALPKAAEYLRELLSEFGNIGLAAAAYNAGPQRVQDWLIGKRTLPAETRAYVQIVTGRSAVEWSSSGPQRLVNPILENVPCVESAKITLPLKASPVVPSSHPASMTRLDPPTLAWAVQLIGDESEAKALARYSQLRRKYPAILGPYEPVVLRTALGRNPAAWHRVRVAMDSRQAAESLCKRLQAAGQNCLMQRN
jgi:hypothetical protein